MLEEEKGERELASAACAEARTPVVAHVFHKAGGPSGRQPLAVPLYADVVERDVVVGRVLRALGDFLKNKVRDSVVLEYTIEMPLHFDGGNHGPTVAAAVENGVLLRLFIECHVAVEQIASLIRRDVQMLDKKECFKRCRLHHHHHHHHHQP